MKRKVGLHLFLATIFVIFFCCNKQQSAQQTQPEVQKTPTTAQQPQQQPEQQTQQQTSGEQQTEATPPASASNSAPESTPESTEQSAKQSAPDTSEQSSSAPEQNADASASHFRMPAFWQNPDAAGVLPPTLDPATVLPEAQAAYLIAQQKPKLLAQMPCFCYCDRFGHKSLHDCYVGTHAEHCDVCLEEAIEADQLEKQGMSPEEIRALIVAKHHPPS